MAVRSFVREVLLQPFTYDPSEKNKHKFMVQYLYLNDEEMQLTVNDILNLVSFERAACCESV